MAVKFIFNLIAAIPLFFVFSCCIDQPFADFKITCLDVGQGSSTLIQTKDVNILVDAGGDEAKRGEFNQFFINHNIQVIDYLIITHPDYDHYGFLTDVYQHWQINWTILPNMYGLTYFAKSSWATLLNVINVEPNHQIIYCQKTLNFRIGRLQLTINDVDENWYVSNHQDSNNLSPFITINWYNYNVLLTGDCLSDKEQLLISTIQCPVDLYIMGHHGSSSSSSLDLLDKIRPQFVFYSSSDPTGTRYGHPNVNALARIKQYTKYIVGTEYNHHIEFNLTNDQAINSLILTTTGWTKKGGERITF